MRKTTLNALGLGASTDVPAAELFAASVDCARYGFTGEDLERVRLLREFVAEYNREVPADLSEAVSDSGKAAALMYPMMKDLDHEELWAVYLNKTNRPLDRRMICCGSLDSTTIDIRRTVKGALDFPAAGVILYHNHPSGNPAPSAADVRQTETLRNALKLFEVSLVDHIIISPSQYYSFADGASRKMT